MNMFHKRPRDVPLTQYEEGSGDEGEKAWSLPVSGLRPSRQMGTATGDGDPRDHWCADRGGLVGSALGSWGSQGTRRPEGVDYQLR